MSALSWKIGLEVAESLAWGQWLIAAEKLLPFTDGSWTTRLLKRCVVQRGLARLKQAIARTSKPHHIQSLWSQWRLLTNLMTPQQRGRHNPFLQAMIAQSKTQLDDLLASGQYSNALALASTMLRCGPSFPDLEQWHECLIQLNQADAARQTGNWSEAVSQLQSLIVRYPQLNVLREHFSAWQEQSANYQRLMEQLIRSQDSARTENQTETLAKQMINLSPRDDRALQTIARIRLREAVENHDSRQQTTWLRSPATAGQSRHSLMLRKPESSSADFSTTNLMWIDGVGGILLVLSDNVRMGRYVDCPGIEIAIAADLRRRHASIRRNESGYELSCFGPGSVNGQSVPAPYRLQHGDRVELSGNVHLEFFNTDSASRTALISLGGSHRTIPWSDRIVLMGDYLTVGSDPSSHIVCADWDRNLRFFRHGKRLLVSSDLPVDVDGQSCSSMAVGLHADSVIQSDCMAITMEPVYQTVN